MIIKINDNTKEYLETLRIHPRETWDDLIQKLIQKRQNKNEQAAS
jgi:hypothetical protein